MTTPTSPDTRALEDVEKSIGAEIIQIMETYDAQVARSGYPDTPGGLEHMRDVWSLLDGWRDQLRAALSITQPPALTDQWQPIETAPKDGKWFLGFQPGWDRASIYAFGLAGDCYELTSSSNSASPTPTHWQPLPAPPIRSHEKETK